MKKQKGTIRNVLSADLFIHLVVSVWSLSPVLVNKLSVAFIIHFDVQTIPVLVSGHPFKLDSVSPGRSSPGTSLLSGIKNVPDASCGLSAPAQVSVISPKDPDSFW